MPTADVTARDPFIASSKDFYQNPFPYYEELRKEGNILWSDGSGEPHWIVVGHERP